MTNFPGKIFRHVFLLIAFVSPMFAAGAAAPQVSLSVDATEAPRKIFHARMTIPAKPGTPHSLLSQVDSRRARPHRPDSGPCRTEVHCQWQASGLAARSAGWLDVSRRSACRRLQRRSLAGFHLARRIRRGHLHRRRHGHRPDGSDQLERHAAVSRGMDFG